MYTYFQIDILAIDGGFAKIRIYMGSEGTCIAFLPLSELNRMKENGTITMFDTQDSAGVIGTSKCLPF